MGEREKEKEKEKPTCILLYISYFSLKFEKNETHCFGDRKKGGEGKEHKKKQFKFLLFDYVHHSKYQKSFLNFPMTKRFPVINLFSEIKRHFKLIHLIYSKENDEGGSVVEGKLLTASV